MKASNLYILVSASVKDGTSWTSNETSYYKAVLSGELYNLIDYRLQRMENVDSSEEVEISAVREINKRHNYMMRRFERERGVMPLPLDCFASFWVDRHPDKQDHFPDIDPLLHRGERSVVEAAEPDEFDRVEAALDAEYETDEEPVPETNWSRCTKGPIEWEYDSIDIASYHTKSILIDGQKHYFSGLFIIFRLDALKKRRWDLLIWNPVGKYESVWADKDHMLYRTLRDAKQRAQELLEAMTDEEWRAQWWTPKNLGHQNDFVNASEVGFNG